MNSVQQEEFIQKTIEDLMVEQGFTVLPESEKRKHQLIAQEYLLLAIGTNMINELPNGQREEYIEKFVNTNQQESAEAKQFLRNAIPDMGKVLAKSIAEFQMTYRESN